MSSNNVGQRILSMTKPTGNKIGRPKKSEIAAIKENRGVGRPRGDKAIMEEYKLRMLNSPKSAKVLEKVYEVALTDGHPGQMAAMKLVMDRIVPQSAFDVTKSSGGGVPQISINITGLNEPKADIIEDITDVEIKPYTDTQ
jgi:hypothetical protein